MGHKLYFQGLTKQYVAMKKNREEEKNPSITCPQGDKKNQRDFGVGFQYQRARFFCPSPAYVLAISDQMRQDIASSALPYSPSKMSRESVKEKRSMSSDKRTDTP